MSDIFNTLFEVLLRALLVLEAAGTQRISTDMIATVDFITVYGKGFDVSGENLHGDNNFKFSEFAVRRDTVKKAVKQLVPDGLVTVGVKRKGGVQMIISYNKLWHLMLDKKMSKRELRDRTGISTASIAKLGKGENVTTDVLVRICVALGCDITEIMELTREDETTEGE